MNGIKLTTTTLNSNFTEVKAWDGAKEVGSLLLMRRRGYWTASHVGVVPSHRRRGIATAMYALARKQGMVIQPSEVQSPDGEALWASFSR